MQSYHSPHIDTVESATASATAAAAAASEQVPEHRDGSQAYQLVHPDGGRLLCSRGSEVVQISSRRKGRRGHGQGGQRGDDFDPVLLKESLWANLLCRASLVVVAIKKQRFLEHVQTLSLQMKRNIFHYHTGTLLDKKHAARFKMSTSLQCSLCQQADSALHILSGCQHTIISSMITERHNDACRLIMKAISKGSLAGCLVHLDAGSTTRLALQNLQIPKYVNNRTLPSWLFDARSSARDKLTSCSPVPGSTY